MWLNSIYAEQKKPRESSNRVYIPCVLNSSPPGQDGRHFADDNFRCIFVNWLKFVPNGTINYNPALVQIMAGHRIGNKPLSEPMLTDSLTHICDTRGRWFNVADWWVKPSYSLISILLWLLPSKWIVHHWRGRWVNETEWWFLFLSSDILQIKNQIHIDGHGNGKMAPKIHMFTFGRWWIGRWCH